MARRRLPDTRSTKTTRQTTQKTASLPCDTVSRSLRVAVINANITRRVLGCQWIFQFRCVRSSSSSSMLGCYFIFLFLPTIIVVPHFGYGRQSRGHGNIEVGFYIIADFSGIGSYFQIPACFTCLIVSYIGWGSVELGGLVVLCY